MLRATLYTVSNAAAACTNWLGFSPRLSVTAYDERPTSIAGAGAAASIVVLSKNTSRFITDIDFSRPLLFPVKNSAEGCDFRASRL